MNSNAATVEEYLESMDPKWKDLIGKLKKSLEENLPEGFEETMSYGMIGFVVPHSIYPKGYHVNPKEPLPFISLAAQKNNVSLYHMGIYDDEGLLDWFNERYMKDIGRKPNIGKSCIRFKKESDVPYQLLEDLFQKISVEDHIKSYEESMKKLKKDK
jgi:uncharacterized protein YdhG (YjbR/CyaY superfamily)